MTENRKTPKLRFKGFTDAWEQRKLGEICQVTMGQSPDGTTYSEVPLGYILVQGNADLNNGWVCPRTWTTQKTKTAEKGDLILSVRAPAGAVGKTSYNVVIGRGVAGIKGNEFIYQSLIKMDLGGYWRTIAAGSTFESINSDAVNNAKLMVPQDIEEQNIVGGYLYLFDKLITLHQRKLERLKNVKKSMLDKMFPKDGEVVPEIRFKGFTDAWEQRKWSDTVCISTEMVDPKVGEYDNLPHVAPGNIESFTGQIYDNVKLVKDENLISGKFHFYDGDIIYGKINPQLGKYVFARFEGLTSADAYVLNAKNGITQEYIYSILQTKDFYDYSVSVSKRSGMPKINRDELNAYCYLAPSLQEQKQIGIMFLHLDNLITLHQRKLDKLKNIKKSMLDNMFV